MAKHSCETQLVTQANELLHGVAKGKQYDLSIIVFRKAIDVFPHLYASPRQDPVLWENGSMPGLNVRLPEEQVSKDGSRW